MVVFPFFSERGGLAPQPMGLGLVVILGNSGGVNGVDQLRLDVASRMPKSVDWSSAFFHVVLGSFFNHPLPMVVGDTEA